MQDTAGWDVYKIFEDLFLSKEERDDRLLEGIQSEDQNKIRCDSGDKKTPGVDVENTLNSIYGKKYRIRLNHQILTDHGVFYPTALSHHLIFELLLAPASQVFRGEDPAKLKYKLKNLEIEYETIDEFRRKDGSTLAEEASKDHFSGKSFSYDHVQQETVVSLRKEADRKINLKINPNRRSLKAVLLLFIEPYTAGTRDNEKYIFPDLSKVKVSIKGSPNKIFTSGLEPKDFWEETKRYFHRNIGGTQYMTPTKYYTENKFGLLIDLRSMVDQTMHRSGKKLVDVQNGVFLEIKRAWKAQVT